MTAARTPLGPSVPQRGNAVTRLVARGAMRLSGWSFSGAFPDVGKAVIIVAPHTSNWDFTVGVMAMFALGLRLNWLGKHTLFRPPLTRLMRWLGGLPVRRDERSGTVAQAVARLRGARQLLLVLAPEGTRSAVTRWRMGFAHIAAGAGVPVVPIAFDWGAREVRLGGTVDLSGDLVADEARLRQFFAGARGFHPDRAG